MEQEIDAEVVDGGAEVNGRLLAGVDGGEVEGVAGAFEHGELFGGGGVVVGFEAIADEGGVEIRDLFGGAVGAAGGAFEEVDFLLADVVNAAEGGAAAEGPGDGHGGEAEDGFEFVEEGERVEGGPVALVHEGEDGHPATAADLEELTGLRFDALGGVDNHEGGVDGGEDAVGVFGEVFMAGGVEEVDGVTVVIELEDGGGDGDAALALERHPVGGGGALIFAGGDGAGEVHGVAVEEEFLSEGGLAGVGVRDDGEGAAAGDFGGGRHGKPGSVPGGGAGVKGGAAGRNDE